MTGNDREQLAALAKERDKIAWGNEQALRVLQDENARLKAALEFYADEDTYMWWLTDQPTLIEADRGERARKALEGGSR